VIPARARVGKWLLGEYQPSTGIRGKWRNTRWR
jgi:hypothetical protein